MCIKKKYCELKLALTEKNDTYTYIFIFLLEANSRRCFLYSFFKFYSKFPFDSYIIICILEIRKKKNKKMRKSRENLCKGILFLTLNSTFLHISFPGRQMTKAREISIFFYQKANKISYWYIAYLSLMRELVNIHQKKTYKTFSVNCAKLSLALWTWIFFFLKFLTSLFIKLKMSGLWNFIRKWLKFIRKKERS